MSACDVLVLPSRTTPAWKEQYGRILVEAMACGMAVIGSDSGEIPHLIRRADGGVVFPEGDAAAMARELRGLVEDRARLKRYQEQGRKYVESELTHDAVARDLAAKTAEMAAMPPRRPA
jgi:glycosyltransferase involved in cell wall biosynthesis